MKNALALCILSFFAGTLHATIRYTEVNEEVYTNSPRSYDIDLDGNDDFSFTAVDLTPSTNSASFYVTALKPSSYYSAESSGGERPKAYADGAALGLHTFVSDTGLLASPSDGNFRNATKYLIVKFSDGTNDYFGWFLLEKLGFDNLQVVAFAYSDVPNDTILAGETQTTGVQEAHTASFNVTVFTRHNIAFENCTGYDKVLVYSIDGKTIAEINSPVAFRNYPINCTQSQLLVAFFRGEKLLHTAKRFLE